ncbi:MAG: cytochrome b [Sphingomonadales bacterium]|nr:cytochrome b [Sphingomonadales bacterium]
MDTVAASAARYSRGAVILHWLIALLIVLNFAAAWVSEDMPKEQAAQVMANHKAIGITILLLTVIRIVWRLVHRPPPLASTLAPWEAALSKITHGLFYLLMLAMPLSGWLMHSAYSGGAPVSLFGIVNWPGAPLAQNKALAHSFGDGHGAMATIMLVLLAIHVAGALKHRIIDKDRNALLRMSLRKG